MEHDILTEPPRTLRRRSCPVRMHDDAAPAAFLGPAHGRRGEALTTRPDAPVGSRLSISCPGLSTAVVAVRPDLVHESARHLRRQCSDGKFLGHAEERTGTSPGVCQVGANWQEISESIELFYNRQWHHSGLGNCSPAMVAQQLPINSQRHEAAIHGVHY